MASYETAKAGGGILNYLKSYLIKYFYFIYCIYDIGGGAS